MVIDHICVNYGADLFQELFNQLHVRGVEQNVFYPRNKNHPEADMDRPYRIDSPLILGTLTKVSFQRKQNLMRQMYDPLFQRNKPDLIHAHTLFSDGSLAYHYFKDHGIPYVVAIRSSDVDVFLKYKPWLQSFGRKIVENASYIVFISPSVQKKFLKKFGRRYESKSMVLPNGINQSYFHHEVTVKKKAHTPPELLYVGSFLKRKKVPALIRLAEITGSRLTIVGAGGDEEKKVLQMIRNSDMITYPGRIEDQSRLIRIYQKSDIFIMTSKRETFGLVYLEAMSQGLPVIYSTSTGIDGLFEEGTVGYGVSPGSLTGIKEAIESILKNYQDISNNCISESRKFTWEDIARRYLAIYQDAKG